MYTNLLFFHLFYFIRTQVSTLRFLCGKRKEVAPVLS